MKKSFRKPIIFQFESGERQTNCLAYSDCGSEIEWEISEYLKADIAQQLQMAFCSKCIDGIKTKNLTKISSKAKTLIHEVISYQGKF
jgi:hypothetical protein